MPGKHVEFEIVAHYWEAWRVADNSSMTTVELKQNFSDESKRSDPQPNGTWGAVVDIGTIKFFLEKQPDPKDPKKVIDLTGDLGDPITGGQVLDPATSGFGGRGQPNYVEASHDAPSTEKKPSWWNRPSSLGERTAFRIVAVEWNNLNKPTATVKVYADPTE